MNNQKTLYSLGKIVPLALTLLRLGKVGLPTTLNTLFRDDGLNSDVQLNNQTSNLNLLLSLNRFFPILITLTLTDN